MDFFLFTKNHLTHNLTFTLTLKHHKNIKMFHKSINI
jgi:hypothetical protein